MFRSDRILAVSLLSALTAIVVATAVAALVRLVKGDDTHLSGWIEALAALVTAIGTVALSIFTTVLARETKRLADVGDQPNIVVTFEPNRHSISHLDLHVENTGTATAYDIEVAFSPRLQISGRAENKRIPLQNISVLKSKQALFSSLCHYGELQTKSFTVTTSWRRRPSEGEREELSYTVDVAQMEGMSHLGGDPTVEGARAAKKIADEIERISRGHNKLAVDIFNSADRAEEERLLEERYNREEAPAMATTPVATPAQSPAGGEA